MNQLTPEKLKEYQLLRDEKINKIKSSTNPDYIRSVFNGSKDCEAIISYQNTIHPLDGKMLINRLHIKNREKRFEDYIKMRLLEEIAYNPNTPKDVLEKLIEIGYYRVFKVPHCPEDIRQKIMELWEQLSEDKTKPVIPPFMQKRMAELATQKAKTT